MNWRSDGIYVTIVPETLFRELSSEEDSSFARILFLVLYSSAGTYSGWGIHAEKNYEEIYSQFGPVKSHAFQYRLVSRPHIKLRCQPF